MYAMLGSVLRPVFVEDCYPGSPKAYCSVSHFQRKLEALPAPSQQPEMLVNGGLARGLLRSHRWQTLGQGVPNDGFAILWNEAISN